MYMAAAETCGATCLVACSAGDRRGDGLLPDPPNTPWTASMTHGRCVCCLYISYLGGCPFSSTTGLVFLLVSLTNSNQTQWLVELVGRGQHHSVSLLRPVCVPQRIFVHSIRTPALNGSRNRTVTVSMAAPRYTLYTYPLAYNPFKAALVCTLQPVALSPGLHET